MEHLVGIPTYTFKLFDYELFDQHLVYVIVFREIRT